MKYAETLQELKRDIESIISNIQGMNFGYAYDRLRININYPHYPERDFIHEAEREMKNRNYNKAMRTLSKIIEIYEKKQKEKTTIEEDMIACLTAE